MEVISVGFGNFVMKSRIVAIIKVGSLPIKKIKEEAIKKGDIIVSSLSTDTIKERINS